MRRYCILKVQTKTLNKKRLSTIWHKTKIDVKDKWPLSWQLLFAELEQIRNTSSHIWFDTDVTRKTIIYVEEFIDTYFTACGCLELKFEIEYYICMTTVYVT